MRILVKSIVVYGIAAMNLGYLISVVGGLNRLLVERCFLGLSPERMNCNLTKVLPM